MGKGIIVFLGHDTSCVHGTVLNVIHSPVLSFWLARDKLLPLSDFAIRFRQLTAGSDTSRAKPSKQAMLRMADLVTAIKKEQFNSSSEWRVLAAMACITVRRSSRLRRDHWVRKRCINQ